MTQPDKNLDDLYLPSTFKGDTTLETPTHYYIFDDGLDPGVLRDLRTPNGQGGWQRAGVVQSQMMGQIMQLQQDVVKWHQTSLKLSQEKAVLRAQLVAVEDRNKQLGQILKDEGIEPDDVTTEQGNGTDAEFGTAEVAYTKDVLLKLGMTNGDLSKEDHENKEKGGTTDDGGPEDNDMIVTVRDLDTLQHHPMYD